MDSVIQQLKRQPELEAKVTAAINYFMSLDSPYRNEWDLVSAFAGVDIQQVIYKQYH